MKSAFGEFKKFVEFIEFVGFVGFGAMGLGSPRPDFVWPRDDNRGYVGTRDDSWEVGRSNVRFLPEADRVGSGGERLMVDGDSGQQSAISKAGSCDDGGDMSVREL